VWTESRMQDAGRESGGWDQFEPVCLDTVARHSASSVFGK
jgi:hypothetical protein